MKCIFLFLLFSFISFETTFAADTGVIEQKEVRIISPTSLRIAAQEVAHIYPEVKASVEKTIGLWVKLRPTVVLTKDRTLFQRTSGGNYIVAYVIPQRSLIVIDYTKMKVFPFTIETTLKHELCHLLLHRYLNTENLPKWLDEGIAQWVSDGVAEIMIEKKQSVLDKAILSNKTIPLRALTDQFPEDGELLLLAYEESKSLVEYLRDSYGDKGILKILEYLKAGDNVDEALQKSLSISLDELEARWLDHHKRWITWFSYLSDNLYEILFFIAALFTILGFIRILLKKRAYKDEEWE